MKTKLATITAVLLLFVVSGAQAARMDVSYDGAFDSGALAGFAVRGELVAYTAAPLQQVVVPLARRYERGTFMQSVTDVLLGKFDRVAEDDWHLSVEWTPFADTPQDMLDLDTVTKSFFFLSWAGGAFPDPWSFDPANYWGEGALQQLRVEVVPTPEPAALLLFGAGLCGLAGWMRRKRAKRK